mmetsp:Transcript_4913/g.10368  ORF Transcript_4913/g.10368 Transcript_4913/m.10368 type:complete len:254 (+) Transcript_4913:303-1064(+)
MLRCRIGVGAKARGHARGDGGLGKPKREHPPVFVRHHHAPRPLWCLLNRGIRRGASSSSSNGSSSGSGSDGSARERSGGVAGVGGSEDDGGGGAAATATTPKQRPLLSFSLTPEESLLEITLKENLQLRQRLAFLDPPPRKVGTEDGQGEEEGTRRSGEDDGRGGGGGGDFNGGSESGGGGGVLGKAWLQSPVVSEGLTTFFSRIKEKAADVKESLTSPAPATAAAPPPSAARDAAGTSAGTRIKNDEGDIIP